MLIFFYSDGRPSDALVEPVMNNVQSDTNTTLPDANVGQPATGTKRKQANEGGEPPKKTKLDETKPQNEPPKVSQRISPRMLLLMN